MIQRHEYILLYCLMLHLGLIICYCFLYLRILRFCLNIRLTKCRINQRIGTHAKRILYFLICARPKTDELIRVSKTVT